jgi:ABC-2 type transport system ATP-binding protein
MQILEVKNLTKKFGIFTAVNDISFYLQEGEMLGLLGKNGAGKTTTIQMLLGLTKPTHGTIMFFGKTFEKHREYILQNINFSSTYISMPWFFTVYEILDLFARLYTIPDKQKRITKLLHEFEIAHLANKQFYMLSAGEKTRLFIAKSFLNYPKLILLDEPTASLDPDIAIKIRTFLKKEKKEYNVSVLLTSHNMDEVEELCDRVIMIHKGCIIDENTPENLAKKISLCYIHFIIPDTLQGENFFIKKQITYERKDSQFIVTTHENNVSKLLTIMTKENIMYDDITINKPDLEDYFLEMVKE